MQRKIIPDIVQHQTICALPGESTVYETVKQMVDCDVAAVVVVGDDGKLEGIVTERDVARRVVARDLDVRTTRLADIMTRDPDVLAPDDTAEDALELMRTRSFRHLPVVDSGEVVGMVSIRDLYAAVKDDLEDDIRETEAYVFGDRYGA